MTFNPGDLVRVLAEPADEDDPQYGTVGRVSEDEGYDRCDLFHVTFRNGLTGWYGAHELEAVS